uniref:Uncharacterized protein n=1 Tax=Siphoviridae sp. ctGuJ10 TaxID=2825418 RepID=A0A8S5PUK6_9CAUD|nr:MAG TPA: hypothetical protein [Siphoviridae sp. ctGuJ10]
MINSLISFNDITFNFSILSLNDIVNKKRNHISMTSL